MKKTSILAAILLSGCAMTPEEQARFAAALDGSLRQMQIQQNMNYQYQQQQLQQMQMNAPKMVNCRTVYFNGGADTVCN